MAQVDFRHVEIAGVRYDFEAVNIWDFRALAKAALAAAQLPGPLPTLVEVGTLLATTSRALLAFLASNHAPSVLYTGVDISDRAAEAWLRLCEDAEARAHATLAFWRLPSVEAAAKFGDESCALVFVDACHCYDCVYADIAAWASKVRRGGFLALHDANPTQARRNKPLDGHPQPMAVGVARALEAQAVLLRTMGFKLVEIGKPPETMRKWQRRAWTSVFRRQS